MELTASSLEQEIQKELLNLSPSEINQIFALDLDWSQELENPNSEKAKHLKNLALNFYIKELQKQLEMAYNPNVVKELPEIRKTQMVEAKSDKKIVIENKNNINHSELWQQIQVIIQKLQDQYKQLAQLQQTIHTLTTEQTELKEEIVTLENQQQQLAPTTPTAESTLNNTAPITNNAPIVSETDDNTQNFSRVDSITTLIPQAKLIPMHNPIYQGQKSKPSDINNYAEKSYTSVAEVLHAIQAKQAREAMIFKLILKHSQEVRQLQTSNMNLFDQLKNLTQGSFTPKIISIKEWLNEAIVNANVTNIALKF